MPKQFIVVGIGKFGHHLITRLVASGAQVVAIDSSREQIKLVQGSVTLAIQMDATDPEAFRELDLPLAKIDAAIVTIADDIESSIMATLVLKELGVGEVIARATSAAHRRALTKVGADTVVFPEVDMADRVAHWVIDTRLMDYVEISSSLGMATIVAAPEWEGRTLAQINLPKQHGCYVLAIKRDEIQEDSRVGSLAHATTAPRYRRVIDIPGADETILANDALVVVGKETKLHELANMQPPA